MGSGSVNRVHAKAPPTKRWFAIQWEDNEPDAQTVRPGAVWPVRGLLGGTTSPAALFHWLIIAFCVRGATRAVWPYLPSTSFQNSAADLPLIVSRVLNERRNSASRSRRKSHLMSLSGIPSSGDVSVTPVPTHHNTCRGIPCSGDRSATLRQSAT